MRLGFLTIVLGSVWLGVSAWAVPSGEVDLSRIPFNNFADDFVIKKGKLNGDFKHAETWEGTFCNGYTEWKALINGRVADLNVQYREDNTLVIYGDIRALGLDVSGAYTGDWSFCAPLELSHRLDADRGELRATAKVYDVPNQDKPDVKLKISETKFGHIDYHVWLPGWLQDELTGMLNETLAAVWSSDVGTWLSDYISEQLLKQKPSPEKK
jgi:hypothetical protein